MALAITRKPNEKIVIETETGEIIIINVASLKSATSDRSAKVTLAIQAPKHIRIDRAENYSTPPKMKLASGQLV